MSQLTLSGGEVFTRAEVRAQRAASQAAAEAALVAELERFTAACERAAALAAASIVIGPVGPDTLDRQRDSGRWPSHVWDAALLEPRRRLQAAASAAGVGQYGEEDHTLVLRTSAALMVRLGDVSSFYQWWFQTAYTLAAREAALASRFAGPLFAPKASA